MRRNNVGLKVSNVLLSLLVVAIFLYLLILAMAQDQVLEKLSRSSEFANYSASLLDARNAKVHDEEIKPLAKIRQDRKAEVARVQNAAAAAELEYQREAVRLDSVFEKIDGKGDCRIIRKPGLAVSGLRGQELDRHTKGVALASAQQCFDVDPQLGGDARKTYMAILARAQSRTDLAVEADIKRKAEAQQSKVLQDEIARQVKDRNKLDPARIQFTMLESLEPPGWFPTNFVNYPPFIVHVLLTFFSGMFGALLITMVFVVYPSKLRERVSAKLYYKRVFLGGLVAVTVFIVLTGGASILGGGEVSENDSNVMSFTAIGLLAGMFSDTVADWLGARAKKMFSSGDDDDDDGKRGQDDPADGELARTA
ncbi:MAG TPA: hypothetical protein VEW26_11650 [Allosphingosinicella sp.]|nr:hypothetical protein [Allosphingosinicella sp.]